MFKIIQQLRSFLNYLFYLGQCSALEVCIWVTMSTAPILEVFISVTSTYEYPVHFPGRSLAFKVEPLFPHTWICPELSVHVFLRPSALLHFFPHWFKSGFMILAFSLLKTQNRASNKSVIRKGSAAVVVVVIQGLHRFTRSFYHTWYSWR